MANNDNAQIVPTTDASLQQQQTAAQTQSSLQSVAQPSVGGDSLTCQWQNCGERCPTAEQLYVSKIQAKTRLAKCFLGSLLLPSHSTARPTIKLCVFVMWLCCCLTCANFSPPSHLRLASFIFH